MAPIFKVISLLSIICILACKEGNDVQKYAEQFAQIECRAMQLKDTRFLLADTLRRLEMDTVANKLLIDSLRKQSDITKTRSLLLADSIKMQLEDLIHDKLKSDKDKKLFQETLKKILLEKNCM